VSTFSYSTISDLPERLGGIPLERICLKPHPGSATEVDLIAAMARKDGIYELVTGVLVRKPMWFFEAIIGAEIISLLGDFLDRQNLGLLAGANGTLKILPPQIRYPDVSFVTWERLAGHNLRKERVPHIAPDLAIEVLSESNTPEEIEEKVSEYFQGGVRLVWVIDPQAETAVEYTAVNKATKVEAGGILPGRDVLPGFELNLRQLFENANSSIE
jgi:Uma2 family endonuclease